MDAKGNCFKRKRYDWHVNNKQKHNENIEIDIFTNQAIEKINFALEKFRYNVIIAMFHEIYGFYKKISDSNLNYANLEINIKKTPINRKSLDEINSNVTRYKPDEIEFDPVNFQYKTDVDASGVSQKLKNVTEWDEPSAGTIVVYEFKNGKNKYQMGLDSYTNSEKYDGHGGILFIFTNISFCKKVFKWITVI